MTTQSATRPSRALTLVELLVVIAVVAVLAAILLPAVSDRSRRSPTILCLNNLRQISVASIVLGTENGDGTTTQSLLTNSETMKLIGGGNACGLWETLSNYISRPAVFWCPVDNNCIAATNFGPGFCDSNISYFLNLDGIGKTNSTTILAGDDNLTVLGVPVKPGILTFPLKGLMTWTPGRHHDSGYHDFGNIEMSDGSARLLRNTNLNAAITVTNGATPSFRLVIP